MVNRPKKLAVLCDGTWCGRETGTTTNISLLASMMNATMSSTAPPALSNGNRLIKARYFEGCGLGGTFLEYLFDGATGSDMGTECINTYQYIVENYDKDTEIWMFGHSRGSFTVRCVAGMINNCGIIKKRDTDQQTAELCKEVYKMYRSPYDDEKPNSEKMKRFREKASWNVKTPVKFMGLIDTVGGLGIPKLDAGTGFTWPEFFDQNISGEVEKVYHACSMHDRLWMFQPCRATRDPKTDAANSDLLIEEKWFPGCHYDVGRQQFKFLREGVNAVEKMFFRIPNALTKPVVPNSVCADAVLLWILEAIAKEDIKRNLIPNLATEISDITSRLLSPTPEADLGSGDVYSKMGDYTPAGIFGTAISTISSLAVKLTDHITPTLKLGSAIQEFLGVKTLLSILLAVQDRRIPGEKAEMVHVREADPALGGVSFRRKAGLGRYDSKTYETFQAYLRAIEVIDRKTFEERTGEI